ncbi:MtnX-like HAD-IB family phosphatase [Candidatus Formimonas warabiya]|uniref:HAD-IB family phosphatase n=1 Tax=Formimonas warabiya TaxID=1761012 RepID=A0A3G1KWB2_FORW1|nr:MtnX-like HAD-IB family phosphatase [Candidatus Formimonas warabiya]ATW26495.1 hypothetical protein DCMF_18610 [Candidatus Formimonas warabiya]
MKKIFFIDFDGTITKQDTVDYFTQAFCRDGWKELNEQWEQRKISTVACAQETLKLMDTTAEDFYHLLDTVELDPYFGDFVHLCAEKENEIFILSDGYDLNINYILGKHHLGHLPICANEMTITNNHFLVNFPHLNDRCGQCGTCKKSLIASLTKPHCQTIYIGDGCSDFCASQTTDLIFAKNNLLLYCRENHIPAMPFQDFSDVMGWMNHS